MHTGLQQELTQDFISKAKPKQFCYHSIFELLYEKRLLKDVKILGEIINKFRSNDPLMFLRFLTHTIYRIYKYLYMIKIDINELYYIRNQKSGNYKKCFLDVYESNYSLLRQLIQESCNDLLNHLEFKMLNDLLPLVFEFFPELARDHISLIKIMLQSLHLDNLQKIIVMVKDNQLEIVQTQLLPLLKQ